MIISHVKIIAFQTITNHSFWTFYISGKPVVYNNNQKITWVLGNTRFISRVEHDISHLFTALTREIPCTTLEINRYLRALMYYSLYHWCELDQQKIKSKIVFYFI